MTIEKIKNWVKKHKKGVILAAGGAAAATVGVIIFNNNFRIVPTDFDRISMAGDSVCYGNGSDWPETLTKFGVVEEIWKNKHGCNIMMSDVPCDKLNEACKAFHDFYEIHDENSIGIFFTSLK